MTIALLDSGIGGLTVLHEARRRMPEEDFIYYADTLHVPYGTKPKEQVREFILASVGEIMEHGASALVVACNTATSIAIHALRERYSIPIVGMEPAVKPAVELNRSSGKRVLVVATPLTLRESRFHELVNRVDDQAIVDSLPLPELVEYCERLIFDGPEIETYFRNRFEAVDWRQYGTIVLGCTHFPFYRNALAGLLPSHVRIIDGSAGTVKRLREVLARKGGAENGGTGEVQFLCSSRDEAYVGKMKTALQRYATESGGVEA
ncbi:glutamate racemase [Paenibacillus sp. TRM 82003]|nr:glutamate racemase [Paenibacillus sp. TRM 82003]